jgi:hypothetical protein
MPVPDSERSLTAQYGAHLSWANTPDRAARTAPARRGLDARFLAEAGGDPARAASLRKAYYARLALKSAQARRKARESTQAADQADSELAQLQGEAS